MSLTCSKLPEYGASNQTDVLMKWGLPRSWRAPLPLSTFHSTHICLTFYLIYSQVCLSFYKPSLSVTLYLPSTLYLHFHLCLASSCCHQSPAPCLSVILCLIAIDHYWSHMSANLIKSDKRKYFYRHIWKHNHRGKCTRTRTPSTIDTHLQSLKAQFVFN